MMFDNEYRDEEGFYTLIKRTPAEKKRIEKEDKRKEKQKTKKKNPYKKGGWKHHLFKKLKKLNVDPKRIQDFHFLKAQNYLISADGEKIKVFNHKLSKGKLEKFADKHKDAVILIQTGNCGMYTKIPLKTYLNLANIDKMVVEYRMEAMYDEADENDEMYNVYDLEEQITSINDLMNFINYYRQLILGVMEVQASCCNYTVFEYSVKTVVLFNDGTSKAFKGDFNEVLRYFDFKHLL